jgi:hypothetical protein
MASTFYLTNEAADIASYYRMKLGSKSDCPSMVRAITSTLAGPQTTGIPLTYTTLTGGFTPAGNTLQWLSDPLDGTQSIDATAWNFHLWAMESAAAAHCALRFQLYKFSNTLSTLLLDYNPLTELPTTMQDVAVTSSNATVTTLAAGDRIALLVKIVDSSGQTMGAGQTVTFSYNGQIPYAEGSAYINNLTDTFVNLSVIPLATENIVRQWIQDETNTQIVSSTDIDDAITRAINEFSVQSPRIDVQYYAGDGTTYEFPLPRNWINGISRIVEIEYPADSQIQTFMGSNDFSTVQQVLGQQPTYLLHFTTITPSASSTNTQSAKVRYTTRHVHTTIFDTVPVEFYQAFCQLAASHCALIMMSRYAALGDSTINADAVDFQSKSAQYRNVAKELRARYEQQMGIGDDNPPAQIDASWYTTSSWGTDLLVHRRRMRTK